MIFADAALRYDEPLYRLPSDGSNLIIQATIGSSGAWLDRGLDLGTDRVFRFFKVVRHLHAQPELGRGAEVARKP